MLPSASLRMRVTWTVALIQSSSPYSSSVSTHKWVLNQIEGGSASFVIPDLLIQQFLCFYVKIEYRIEGLWEWAKYVLHSSGGKDVHNPIDSWGPVARGTPWSICASVVSHWCNFFTDDIFLFDKGIAVHLSVRDDLLGLLLFRTWFCNGGRQILFVLRICTFRALLIHFSRADAGVSVSR